MGVTRFGGYATAINADLQYLRPIRAGWTFAEAAAYPVQGLTAWYGLGRLGEVERGRVVLLQSAAGGVGLQALAILAATGARTVAAVGAQSKRQWLIDHRGLAPEQVIVRDRRTFGVDLDCALDALGASGFDLVFDAVAGPFFQPAYDRLQPEGRHVVYGAADFMTPGARVNYPRLALRYLRRPRIDPLRMVSDNRSVMGFNLIWLWDRVERLSAGFDALDALIAESPLVGRRFAFATPRRPCAICSRERASAKSCSRSGNHRLLGRFGRHNCLSAVRIRSRSPGAARELCLHSDGATRMMRARSRAPPPLSRAHAGVARRTPRSILLCTQRSAPDIDAAASKSFLRYVSSPATPEV